jgi:hypothetical protein
MIIHILDGVDAHETEKYRGARGDLQFTNDASHNDDSPVKKEAALGPRSRSIYWPPE